MFARFRLRLYLTLRVALVAVSGVATALMLVESPFAQPLAARTVADARLVLEREMARTVTAEWLLPRLETAVNNANADRVEMLMDLAAEHNVAVPPALAARARHLLEAQDAWQACALCAWDSSLCGSVGQIAMCAIPVEFTPLGDANALRRQAVNYYNDEDVDRIEVSLALVGLGATALAVLTAGTTATLKAGATAIRVARRLGTLTPRFQRVLKKAASIDINWAKLGDYALGRAALGEVTDVARLTRTANMAGDFGTVVKRTSATDALLLLRHVDGAEDITRLARVSRAAGPKTRRTVYALGKSRTFRALLRLGDRAFAALWVMYAFALQLLTLVGGVAGRAALRLLKPRGA